MVAQIVALERDQEAAAARGENRTFLPLPTPPPEDVVSIVQPAPSLVEEPQVAQDRNIVDEDFIDEDIEPKKELLDDDTGNTSIFGFLGNIFGQS